MGSSLLSSKARKVSSLVQKWQSIKQQEEPVLNSSEEEDEEIDPRKQIEDWKREHLARYVLLWRQNRSRDFWSMGTKRRDIFIL